MDKIDIIDYEEDDEDEDFLDDEYEDDSEEERIEIERYEQHKAMIKQKTDREILESISERVHLIERDINQIKEDLVDVYNLILESQDEE